MVRPPPPPLVRHRFFQRMLRCHYMYVIATSVCPMFIPWCFLPVCNYTDSAAAGRGGVVSVASCVLDNDGRRNRHKVTVENAVNHCCAGRVAICTATPVTRKTRSVIRSTAAWQLMRMRLRLRCGQPPYYQRLACFPATWETT